MYVMKNVAFIGIATPMVLGILHKEYAHFQVMTVHSRELVIRQLQKVNKQNQKCDLLLFHKLNNKEKELRFINMQGVKNEV